MEDGLNLFYFIFLRNAEGGKKKIQVGRGLTETTLVLEGMGVELLCGSTGVVSKALPHSLWTSALLREKLMVGIFSSASCRAGPAFVTAAAGCQAARRLHLPHPVVFMVLLAFTMFDILIPQGRIGLGV